MKWEEFKTLETSKQIEIFNNFIKECGSITKASKQLGRSDKTVRGHLTSLGYRFIDGVYIKNTNTQLEGQTSLIEPVCENKEPINEELEQLINRLIDEKLKTKKVDTIELSSKCEGEVKYRSLGAYKEVLDEFIEYCKNKKPYSQIQLFSQALIEFMEKYK